LHLRKLKLALSVVTVVSSIRQDLPNDTVFGSRPRFHLG